VRVHIITEEDPFYVPVFFRELLARRGSDGPAITGIDITPPLNQKKASKLARRLYGFYGPVDFARLGLRYAAVKVKDTVLPRSSWAGTLSRLFARHGLPSRHVPNVNDADYVESLRRLEPDLLVSVAASQIFKAELLSVPRLGAINIHTGSLPRYRGMMPVFWQLHDGQPEIGITIHTMTPEIDLGQVLLHRRVAVREGATLDETMREMKRHGAQAMLDLWRQYDERASKAAPMDRSQGAYRSFPRRADADALRRMGTRLL
jgi:methionyl-tRNA formyltransferase